MTGAFCLRFLALACITICLASVASFAASIDGITAGPITVVPGDIVTLDLKPSPETVSSKPIIEWWSGGELQCQGSKCEVDTSQFDHGDFYYDAVVMDDGGMATSRVVLKVQNVTPLYTPKMIAPSVLEPTKDMVTTAQKGDWILVERLGGITYPTPGKALKFARIRGIDIPNDHVTYSVSAGGQGIVRRVGNLEQWLVTGGSSFEFVDQKFRLLSGQAIWRKSGKDEKALSRAEISNVEIQGTGSAFLGIEIKDLESRGKQIIIRNFESKHILVICGELKPTDLVAVMTSVVEIDSDGKCKKINPEARDAGDPYARIIKWSPWWGKSTATNPGDRFRVEWQFLSGDSKGDEILNLAESARAVGACADAIDILGPRQNVLFRDAKFWRLLGECQFDLAMYKRAIHSFSQLSQLNVDQGWSAYMRARAYRYLGQHKVALDWFDRARILGYENIPELARDAAKTAEFAGEPRKHLIWLETAWLDEDEPAQKSKDREMFLKSTTDRSFGVVVRGEFTRDSQAFPVNLDEENSVSQPVSTSQSFVVSGIADWWKSMAVSKDATLKISGVHLFAYPTSADLVIAGKSLHEAKANLFFGPQKTESQVGDDWVVGAGTVIGTGISGTERQRDRLGWMLEVARPQWLGLSISLESSKYLDPTPNGGDVIDLDLDRYTGPGDHSHFDLMASVGLEATKSQVPWRLQFVTGQVDYRTGSLDVYDHTLIKAEAEVEWTIISPRLTLVGAPYFTSRMFKEGTGSDLTTGLNTRLSLRMRHLWQICLLSTFENRSVASDPATSWTRYRYGFGVTALF